MKASIGRVTWRTSSTRLRRLNKRFDRWPACHLAHNGGRQNVPSSEAVGRVVEPRDLSVASYPVGQPDRYISGEGTIPAAVSETAPPPMLVGGPAMVCSNRATVYA